MSYNKNILDTDPQETQDWIDSINALIDEKGAERTHFIIEKLIDFSRRSGVKIPFSPYTEYLNTISVDSQESYPGNRSIERRIKSLVRWNAMAMVGIFHLTLHQQLYMKLHLIIFLGVKI